MKRRKSVKGRMTGEELRDHQIRTAKGMMEMYEQDRRQKREGGFEVDAGVYMVKHAADALLARAGVKLVPRVILLGPGPSRAEEQS
jgi:hypothetical protein